METSEKVSREESGFLHVLFDRLSPPMKLALFFAIILGTIGIFVFAIRNGAKINIFGVKIEGVAQDTSNSGGAEITKQTTESPGVSASELSLISDEHFRVQLSKDEIILRIKELVKSSDELEELKGHIFFKLLDLEIRIVPKFAGSIDTRINDESPQQKDAFKRIQSVLKDIGFYDGVIDGNQQLTFNALKDFQSACNRRERKTVFPPEDFGLFGNLTLGTIRNIVKARERKS